MEMNFIGRFLQRSGFLDNPYPSNFLNQMIGNKDAVWIDTDNLGHVYDTIAHLQVPIDKIAQMVSNGIWQYTINDEVQEGSEYVDLLNEPNFLQSGKDFIASLSINEDIFGNAFVYQNKTSFSKAPKLLWVLPSANMQVKKTGKLYKQSEEAGVISGYVLDLGDTKEPYETADIIRFKQGSKNILLGESKIKTLKPQLSNINGAYESRNVMINNKGALGVLTVNSHGLDKNGNPMSTMSKPEKKQAEKSFTENYGIKRGQQRFKVTTIPTTWTPITTAVKDMMLFEEVADDFEVILNTLGLNKNLFVNATYDNYQTAQKSAYTDTIIPRAERYAETLTKSFGLPKGHKLTLDYSHLTVMQDDEKIRADVTKVRTEIVERLSAMGSSLVDTDEKRNELIKHGI